MTQRVFDPIIAARDIESSYREYLEATIHFDDRGLQKQLEDLLAKPGYLSKGPFLESAAPYKKGATPRQLIDEGVFCESMLRLGGGDRGVFDPDRPLYTHQERAMRLAHAGKNYAVVTGTGSGKTECFLLPILNDILSEFEGTGPAPGVRALILYPMNALANDQLKRLRALLRGTGVTFGRYTGDTKQSRKEALKAWQDENPGLEKPAEEIISRDEVREAPPNILLTNYSMLEYLLLRPEDAPLFSDVFGRSWRHLAIDEAHVYSGSLGTEVAYLIRRLKARIDCSAGPRQPLHCYATSATIGTDRDMPKVAQFAEDLFGEPFDHDDEACAVVRSDRDSPTSELDEVSWGTLPLDRWARLRDAVSHRDAVSRTDVAAALEGAPTSLVDAVRTAEDPLTALGSALLGEGNVRTIVERLDNDVFDLTDRGALVSLGMEGLGDDAAGMRTLSAMVEVLSAARRSSGVPILSSRYHSFLRAPEGLYINLLTNRLTVEKRTEEPIEGSDGLTAPVYEVSVCRHCGQAYILGKQDSADRGRVAWLNPRYPGIDVNEDTPPRLYYRLIGDERGVDESEDVAWLCPACGSLHSEPEGGAHRFDHEPCRRVAIARGEDKTRGTETSAQCLHCGYTNRYAIQPMRVSPEAAGSVVCYDLVREVPPFEVSERSDEAKTSRFSRRPLRSAWGRAGSVICFSDRRQDAAFFAPAMERTYDQILRRQMIYQGVRELSEKYGSCSPSDVAHWLAGHNKGMRRRSDGRPVTTIELANMTQAWVLDELMAEDFRNSLEGLGLIKVTPAPLLDVLEGEDGRAAVAQDVADLCAEGCDWITERDYLAVLRFGVESLRWRRGVLQWPEGADSYRTTHARPREVVAGDSDDVDARHQERYVGAPGARNNRFRFVERLARELHGAEPSPDEIRDALLSAFRLTCEIAEGVEGGLERTDRGFELSEDLWSLAASEEGERVFRCARCGITCQFDTGGVCVTRGCDGRMEPVDPFTESTTDRYYKEVCRQAPLPVRIEEHTAQLSSERARLIQSEFLQGKVNVLSCTTTFELGVDVGDLRCVFMRNVPPSPANYAQRAGRTGRRAGMPGFAVTFARLRPHDVQFFNHPLSVIKGETRVPACYLTNRTIALRHVFAVALSSFFRSVDDGEKMAKTFNAFLDVTEERPEGLDRLSDYLRSHPADLAEELRRAIPSQVAQDESIGLDSWAWVGELLGESGRLRLAHQLLHEDYADLRQRMDQYLFENTPGKARGVTNSMQAVLDKLTIPVLAESGVLPKYGFPTDVVSLRLKELETAGPTEQLDLSRGMRQAIREYAPGSEVVAGKRLWRSTGIRRLRGRPDELHYYGVCPTCKTFTWRPEDESGEIECPVCHETFKASGVMLVPRFGFVGEREGSKGVGESRPRARGSLEVHFGQDWADQIKRRDDLDLPAGKITYAYGTNVRLCVTNSGPQGRGFQVCSYCGAAAPATEELRHERWCQGKMAKRYSALGAVFRSDVLELEFCPNSLVELADEDWRSAMWALHSAAALYLEVPETEIGATTYLSLDGARRAILLYDDVPGGAGRVDQLSRNVRELLTSAYQRVRDCEGCSIDSCCYGCLANYYNQAEQSTLSRRGALRVFDSIGVGELLGEGVTGKLG